MIKPLEDRVLIKILKNEETTKGGIILTSGNQKTQLALIIEVGTGTDKIKMQVKKGQKVIINKNSGTEIKYEDEDLIIINQSDILAVIE